MSFKSFLWHFNFVAFLKSNILGHYDFEVELKKYFWRQFNLVDFRSQLRHREIFLPFNSSRHLFLVSLGFIFKRNKIRDLATFSSRGNFCL